MKNLGGIILAGGKSSRMGTDKGLLPYQGKPMVTYAINLLKQICDQLIIVSNQKEYEQFDIPVNNDVVKSIGPLSGIYTGLSKSNYDVNVVLSCDTPNITATVIISLLEHISDYDCCIAKHNSQLHPLCGVYKKGVKDLLLDDIQKGQYKLVTTLQQLNCKMVEFNHLPASTFKNINYSADLIA